MSNPLLVGIDPHRKTNTMCVMDREGDEVCDRFTVQNNRPGTESFVREVAQHTVEGGFDAIHVAAEATGWYWWHFHSLDTIPGFGPVFSGGIVTEIGDVARFDYNQAKVTKYAGLKWRKTKLADFQAEETRLTRTGNRYLRYYLCEAANRVRQCAPEYTAYYDRKFHEVRKHQHKRAIVLTARKLVRLVVRLLTTNELYRPRRC